MSDSDLDSGHSPSRIPIRGITNGLPKPVVTQNGKRASLLPQRRIAQPSTAATAQGTLIRSECGSSAEDFPSQTTRQEPQKSATIGEETAPAIYRNVGAQEQTKADLEPQARKPFQATPPPKPAGRIKLNPPSFGSRVQSSHHVKSTAFEDDSNAATRTHVRDLSKSAKPRAAWKAAPQIMEPKDRQNAASQSRRIPSAPTDITRTKCTNYSAARNSADRSRHITSPSAVPKVKAPGLPTRDHGRDHLLDNAQLVSSGAPSHGKGNSNRPAFSTLQQHFSPRKTSKLPASSSIALSSKKSIHNILPSATIVRLQSELLQLHVMHISSAKVQQQWEHSAELRLRRHFEDARAMHWKSHIAKGKAQEKNNIEDVRVWSNSSSALGFAERIQVLSSSIHEIYSTVDDDGRFAHLVETFIQWVDSAQQVWRARSEHLVGLHNSLEMIEGLGIDWKADCRIISRKIDSCRRNIVGLPTPLGESSLAAMVRAACKLGACVVEELDVMQSTERQIVEDERDWLEQRILEIASDKPETTHTDRKGAWQASHSH